MTAVLITGCSSGIGRATALRLARRGDLTVYATARRPESLADLTTAGCRVLPLDVTDESRWPLPLPRSKPSTGRWMY